MKTKFLLLIGATSGIVLGISIHSLIHKEVTSSPLAKEEQAPESNQPHLDEGVIERERPTLEQILESSGPHTARLVAQYLEGATMDEIIALLEIGISDKRSHLSELIWLMQIRALELDPSAVLAWAREQEDALILIQDLYERWGVLDPDAALRASLKENSGVRWRVMNGLKKADPELAFAAVKDFLPHAPEYEELERLNWEAAVSRDAKGALELALAIEDPEERESSLRAVVASWADQDPLAALDWLDQHDEELEGTEQLRAIAIEKLAETRPSFAYSKIDAIPLSRTRSLLEGKVARKWVEQDRDTALEWLKSQPEGPAREHLFAAMSQPLALDPEGLIQLASELGVSVHSSDAVAYMNIFTREDSNWIQLEDSLQLPGQISNALHSLAQESPIEAFRKLRELGGNDYISVASAWVESDAMGAAEWAAALPESEFSTKVQEAIVQKWAEGSAPEVAEFMVKNGITVSERLTAEIAGRWAGEDTEAAMKWIDQLEPEVQQGATVAAMESAASTDPMQALQYIDQISDQEVQDKILQLATENWRKSDPSGVMGWLRDQPPEAEIDDIVMQTTKAWVLERPLEASTWIEAMEASPRRDQAVVGLVEGLVASENPNKDVEAAVAWAGTISDRELKEKWLTEIVTRTAP